MSIFNAGQTTDQTTTQATDQQTPTQSSFLQKLVEAKGEQWKDPEVLAKGKLEADNYISELERQLEELRQDTGKQDFAKQLLEEIQKKATAPNTVTESLPNNDNVGTKSEGTPQPNVSEEDLKSLVEKTLVEREAKATVEQNLATVEKELEAKFGTEASSVVAKKAQELGMSLKRMEEIASESPTAFFALIGEKRQVINPLGNGTIRTEGANFSQTNERNWAYYQKLRRENKSLYFTPKIQQQLMEDKRRLGDKFGL